MLEIDEKEDDWGIHPLQIALLDQKGLWRRLKGHEYKHHDVAAGELIDLEGGREDLAFVDPRVHRVEAHDHRYKLLR